MELEKRLNKLKSGNTRVAEHIDFSAVGFKRYEGQQCIVTRDKDGFIVGMVGISLTGQEAHELNKSDVIRIAKEKFL